jgi:hypothetical protein
VPPSGFRPFWKSLFSFVLYGSYGPASVMSNGVSAYSPNVAWARVVGDKTTQAYRVDRDGGGTSAATPQVAAAAALWFQKFIDDPLLCGTNRYTARKTELIYQALLRSVRTNDMPRFDVAHFGRGSLNAAATLTHTPESLLAHGVALRPRSNDVNPLGYLKQALADAIDSSSKDGITATVKGLLTTMVQQELEQLMSQNAKIDRLMRQMTKEEDTKARGRLLKRLFALVKKDPQASKFIGHLGDVPRTHP